MKNSFLEEQTVFRKTLEALGHSCCEIRNLHDIQFFMTNVDAVQRLLPITDKEIARWGHRKVKTIQAWRDGLKAPPLEERIRILDNILRWVSHETGVKFLEGSTIEDFFLYAKTVEERAYGSKCK